MRVPRERMVCLCNFTEAMGKTMKLAEGVFLQRKLIAQPLEGLVDQSIALRPESEEQGYQRTPWPKTDGRFVMYASGSDRWLKHIAKSMGMPAESWLLVAFDDLIGIKKYKAKLTGVGVRCVSFVCEIAGQRLLQIRQVRPFAQYNCI
jgi:hypothetical protein